MEKFESSITEIWSESFSKIPKNHLNWIMAKSGLMLGLLPIYFGKISDLIAEWGPFFSLMLQVYSGLLGFIIAGYTLFITSSNSKFQLAYWRFKVNEMSLLRLHFIVYMKLFLTVFLGTLLFGFLTLFGQVWPIFKEEMILSEKLVVVCQSTLLAVLGWVMTGSAVQMKVMIFNLYNFSLTQLSFLDVSEKKED